MSGKGRGAHLEPFMGSDLQKFIEGRGGVFDRLRGSHHHYRMPDGTMVGAPKHDQHVSQVLFRQVAKSLDLTYQEARDAIGYPVQKAGKRRKKVTAKRAPRATGKGSVLDRVSTARERLNEIDSALRSGSRDPSVYATCLDLLDEASTAIQRAADVAAGRRAA